MFNFDETFWSTFALTVVNLLVLFIVLKLLLFKPVTKFIDNRNNKIEEAIKRRVSIGQRIQYSKLLDEMGLRYTMRNLIAIAITNLVSRGDFKSQSEKQILIRKK